MASLGETGDKACDKMVVLKPFKPLLIILDLIHGNTSNNIITYKLVLELLGPGTHIHAYKCTHRDISTTYIRAHKEN